MLFIPGSKLTLINYISNFVTHFHTYLFNYEIGFNMITKHLVVDKHARYSLSKEPGPEIEKLWFLIHGYGQHSAAFLESLRFLETKNTLLVAPEGLSRFYLKGGFEETGASWMTREDRNLEIKDYCNYLNQLSTNIRSVLKHDVRTGLIGFSQGVHTSCRWLASRDTPMDKVVLCGADIPADVLNNAALLKNDLHLLLGKTDKFLAKRPMDNFLSEVKNVPTIKVHTYDGGHEIPKELLKTFIDL